MFGAILSISSIVKNEQGPYEFFDRPSRYTKQEHDIMEESIHRVSRHKHAHTHAHTHTHTHMHKHIHMHLKKVLKQN